MRYVDAGVSLAVGSDSQVRIDPFEKARELETGSRREREFQTACSPTRAICGRSSAVTDDGASVSSRCQRCG